VFQPIFNLFHQPHFSENISKHQRLMLSTFLYVIDDGVNISQSVSSLFNLLLQLPSSEKKLFENISSANVINFFLCHKRRVISRLRCLFFASTCCINCVLQEKKLFFNTKYRCTIKFFLYHLQRDKLSYSVCLSL
jgi:hypothetical protein